MATSAISFKGPVSFQNSYEVTLTFNFKPPSNIEGKLCYVEVRGFLVQFDAAVTFDPLGFTLECDWPQSQCYYDNSGSINPRSPLAIYTTGGQRLQSQPVLVSMPCGPHDVTFTIKRVTPEPFSDIADVFIFLSIVPANSRQSPLG